MTIRPWQQEAHDKALTFFDKEHSFPFLIDAAPGSGKTRCASLIAKSLIERKKIERVIIIAPRVEIVNQWIKAFHEITKRELAKVTGAGESIENLELDLCITWQGVKNLSSSLQKICERKKTLLICDEHHHASAVKSWGQNAGTAFEKSKFTLVLTGTWSRADGEDTIWFNNIEKEHPKEALYRMTYGEAVDKEYCRPATFHRHQGHFIVTIDDDKIKINGHGETTDIPKELKKLKGLEASLKFYTLARTPLYEKDLKTPKIDSYQGTMLQAGIEELNNLQFRRPDAGGLVIAPNIKIAEYMKTLLGMLDSEEPAIIHSHLGGSENQIKSFRNSKKRWLVSVGMVSEGVDIPRLRVLVYLPNSTTELSFRQALGRVVRNHWPKDDTRAYIIIPRLKQFEEYAKRIEREMPERLRKDTPPKTKKCHQCEAENDLGAKKCKECGFDFPSSPSESATPLENKEFLIELDEAMRQGAIVREIDIEEEEVLEGEAMADDLMQKIQQSNDPVLMKLVRTLPKEALARLKKIVKD